ncbi:MAG: DUF4307 domain-containing protein [Micrococcus sp.]|nr:DUF4307 domain-containing protein [Micrococcus sp.]
MVSSTSAQPVASEHTPPASLANRYGAPQRREPGTRARTGRWIAVAALALAIVVTGWFALSNAAGRIDYKDVGYTIHSDSQAQVRFQVSAPAETPVECDVLVLDAQAAPVGFTTVRLDGLATEDRSSPADDTWYYTVDVRTVARGVSGVVETCRRVDA